MPVSPTFEAEAARLQVEGQAVLHSGYYLINNKREGRIDAARSCIQAILSVPSVMFDNKLYRQQT